ncbi:MAG TPA: hypothetical protein VF972_06440, partial [Actinomycetota bacterium]
MPDYDDDESLSEERAEELDDVDRETAAMENAAVAGEAPLRWYVDEMRNEWRKQRSETVPAEAVLAAELADASALDEAFRQRPRDKVKLFDFAGDPCGFGLRDGEAMNGTIIRVARDAIDVVARAEGPNDPIAGPVFLVMGAQERSEG